SNEHGGAPKRRREVMKTLTARIRAAYVGNSREKRLGYRLQCRTFAQPHAGTHHFNMLTLSINRDAALSSLSVRAPASIMQCLSNISLCSITTPVAVSLVECMKAGNSLLVLSARICVRPDCKTRRPLGGHTGLESAPSNSLEASNASL